MKLSNVTLLLGLALGIGSSPIRAEPPPDESWLSGVVEDADLYLEIRSESALGFHKARMQKVDLTLEPELDLDLTHGLFVTAIARLRADAFDRLQPGRYPYHEFSNISRPARIGTNVELELRELYLEGKIGRNLFTIGKQQIVWGKADGLKVLDVVNPQSFREFILDDFDDSRIPLWTVNLEIPIHDVTLQWLWIPDPTYDEIPESDALFAFSAPFIVPPPPPGIPVTVNTVDRPNNAFDDSDIGARLSTFWKGWDLTANYFYHYDDVPVLYRFASLTLSGPEVIVDPSYERTHLVGGTFSNAFGNLTVRGEAGYSTDRYFNTDDLDDRHGVDHAGEIQYVLGLDWWGFTDALVSFQLFQSFVTGSIPGLIRDDIESNVTLLGRRSILNDTLVVETIWIHSLNRNDGVIRPKIEYELSDTVRIWGGVDLFYGTRNGAFGQFGRRDRVVIGLRWGI